MSAEREILIARFLARHGLSQAKRGRLAGDASFRSYDRLEDGTGEGARRRVVLMDAPPPAEDVRPFVRIARHLHAGGFSAPAVLAEDAEAGLLLLEDLGDDTYTRLLARGHSERELYTLAVDTLIALHRRADAVPEGVLAYGLPRLLEEVGRLNTWYLPLVGADAPPAPVLAAYESIWHEILPLAWKVPTSLTLFDFHVDNLILLPARSGIKACGLLDFQDAVEGPITYDLMSLLEDARRDVDPAVVAALRQRYQAAFPAMAVADFETSWAVMAAQRHMRVIGTFARLKLRDRKPHYLQHMPRLWRYMDVCLQHPALADLKKWLDMHVPPALRVVPG